MDSSNLKFGQTISKVEENNFKLEIELRYFQPIWLFSSL